MTKTDSINRHNNRHNETRKVIFLDDVITTENGYTYLPEISGYYIIQRSDNLMKAQIYYNADTRAFNNSSEAEQCYFADKSIYELYNNGWDILIIGG